MANERPGPDSRVPIFAFVPKRFEIEESPELKDFPRNVLFGALTISEGFLAMASAVYEPELESYEASEHGKSLLYYNSHGRQAVVRITRTRIGWEGRKTIDGKQICLTVESSWDDFFQQFTAVGLGVGEPCEFRKII